MYIVAISQFQIFGILTLKLKKIKGRYRKLLYKILRINPRPHMGGATPS